MHIHAPSLLSQSVVANRNSHPDSIHLCREAQTDDWVLEFSPGLDLLEIVRVLNAVQARAMELLHTQVAARIVES